MDKIRVNVDLNFYSGQPTISLFHNLKINYNEIKNVKQCNY